MHEHWMVMTCVQVSLWSRLTPFHHLNAFNKQRNQYSLLYKLLRRVLYGANW